MPDFIEVYLNRLRSRLKMKISNLVVEEHMLEIELHLRDSVARELAQDKSEEEAKRAAIRAFGNDALIAEGLIRQYRGLNNCSDWRFAWIPAGILVSYGALAWGMVDVRWPYPSWISAYAIWVPALLVTTFSISCWRSRRFLMKPIAVAASVFLALILFIYCFFGSSGFSAHSEEIRQANIHEIDEAMPYLMSNLKRAEALEKAAVSGQLDQGQSEAPEKSYMLVNAHSFYVPSIVSIEKKPEFQLTSMSSTKMAKILWKKNGTLYLAQLDRALRDMRSRRTHWVTLRPSFVDVGMFLKDMSWWVLVVCVQLALINGGILVLLKARMIFRSKIWRLPRVV